MANLFIGMGGSGVKTMTALQDQLKANDPIALKNSRFLMIDTDEEQIKLFDNHEKLNLGDANVYQYYTQAVDVKVNKTDADKRFLEWFDTKALATMTNGPLSLGASANRPQGRGAAAIKQIPFREKINRILAELLSMADAGSVDEEVKVYTCCSVAGGTGSSIYLDLMYLLQDVYSGINTTRGELQLWSVLYMPEVFKILQKGGEKVKDDYQTNVFAFWSEINAISKDYYQNVSHQANGAEEASISYNENVFKPFSVFVSDRDFRWKIFKNAILIDYMTSNDKTFKALEMYKNTANLIRYLSDNQIGGQLRSDWDNSTNRLASFSKDHKWIDSFSIAGFRALEGPNQYLKKYFKAKIFSDVFNGLINIDDQDKDTLKQKSDVVAFLNAEFFPSIDCNNDINVDCTSVPNDKNLSVILQNHITEITANNLRKITQAASDKEALKAAGNSIFTDFKQTQENLINDFILKSQGENKKIIDLFHLIFSKKAEKIIQKNGVAYLKEFISILDNDCFTKYYGINKSALDELGSSDSGLGCANVGLEQLIKTIADEISVASTIRIIGKNEDWFSSQLNKLSRAIDLYLTYQRSEFIIKFRMSIYKDLSLGDEGITDIILKRTFDLHNELQKKFSDHDKTFKYSLPAEFTALKERVTHTVIPNISLFVKDATWVNDTSINKFQEFYEDSSLGFSHKRNSQNEKIPVRAKDGESPWTLETVLEKLYPSETFTLLSDSIKFKNNTAIAIQIEKFENELNKYLDADFFNREALQILLGKDIKSWCDKYPDEFKSIQEQFRKNTPLFYKSKQVAETDQKYIWLSNNKDLCDALNGTPIGSNDYIKKEEDIVVFVLCQQGISLDSYMQFDDYSKAYFAKKTSNASLFYPHIHKDFYKNDELLDYFKKYKLISKGEANRGKSIQDLKNQTKNFTPFIQLLFFSNFYEELSSKSDAIIKNYITGSSFDNKESLKLIKFSTSENKITFTYSCINQNYISGRSKFNLDEITTPEQIPTFNFIDYLWNADKNFAELFYNVETSINLNKESLTKRKSESASKGGAELETFESLIKNALKNTNAFFETNTFLEQDEIKKCLDMTKIVIKDLKLN
jgi:hypothetical protein